jgi:hypothetical protein
MEVRRVEGPDRASKVCGAPSVGAVVHKFVQIEKYFIRNQIRCLLGNFPGLFYGSIISSDEADLFSRRFT